MKSLTALQWPLRTRQEIFAEMAAGEIAAAVGVRLAPTAEFVTIEITATDAAGAI